MKKDKGFMPIINTIRNHFRFEPRDLLSDYIKLVEGKIERNQDHPCLNDLHSLLEDLKEWEKQYFNNSKQLNLNYDTIE